MKLMLVLLSVAIMSVLGAQNSTSGLSGTTWQLVKFQGPDERVFRPQDKSKYTISFGRSGGVIAQIDCNSARSTWKVTAPDQLKFGSWSKNSAKRSEER